MYEGIRTQMQMVNTKRMVVDYSYQRPLDVARVKKMASHYNQCLVNPIKVSFRDGKYYIFDGQHTESMLVLRNGGDLDVQCNVYYGLTREEEADLFSQQTGALSRKVETNAKMRALYVAGDVDVVELKSAVERAGFIFDFSKSKGNNKIICCSQIYKLFRKMSGSEFSDVLYILKQAWNGDADSMRGEIIGGIAILYISHKLQFNIMHAIDAFSKVSPNAIIAAGKEFKTSDGDVRFARALLRIYNKGKREKNRLSEDAVIDFKWSLNR